LASKVNVRFPPIADIQPREQDNRMFDWPDLALLLPLKVQLGCLVLFLAGGALLFLLVR
jgi:hypothetical protein